MTRGGVGAFFTLGGIGMAVLGGAMLGELSFVSDVVPIPAEGAGIAGLVFLMIGAPWTLVGLGLLAYYRSVARRSAAEAELFRTGTRATAEIEGVEGTATEINDNPQIVLRLRVRAPGGDFVHTRRLVVPRSAVPVPGHLVEVAYDPHDRGRLALDVDDRYHSPPARYVKTRPPDQAPATPVPAASTSDSTWGSMWESAGGDGGGVADFGGGAGSDGNLRELERLADLRDRGALTQEEFERQKGRLLGR